MEREEGEEKRGRRRSLIKPDIIALGLLSTPGLREGDREGRTGEERARRRQGEGAGRARAGEEEKGRMKGDGSEDGKDRG